MKNDPLESELEGIAPRPLSDDFMPRLQARLSAAHSTGRSGWWWSRILTTGLAAAACIAAAAMVWHEVSPRQPVSVTSRPAEHARPDPFLTVAQYEHAYQKSPEALDALLQQRSVGESQQRAVRAYDVMRFDLN